MNCCRLLTLMLLSSIIVVSSCNHSPTAANIAPNIDTLKLKMDIVNGNYQLAWNSPPNGNLSYNVYRRSSDSASWIRVARIMSNSWTDSSIVGNNGCTLYEYALTYATNASNESNMSNPISIYALTDNFNDDVNRWIDSSDIQGLRNVTVSDGELVVNCDPGTHFTTMQQMDGWENVVFEVDAKSAQDMSSNPYYGIGIDIRCTLHDSSWAYYEFNTTINDNCQLLEMWDGKWIVITNDDINAPITQWNSFRVEMNGTHLKGYGNGSLRLDFDPSTQGWWGAANQDVLNHGGIGLSTEGGITFFDNVKVLITSWDTTLSTTNQISRLKGFARHALSIVDHTSPPVRPSEQ